MGGSRLCRYGHDLIDQYGHDLIYQYGHGYKGSGRGILPLLGSVFGHLWIHIGSIWGRPSVNLNIC